MLRELGQALKSFDFVPVNASGGTVAITSEFADERALRLSAVYRAVWVLSSTLAQLPLHVYRRKAPFGKDRASDHPLYAVLHDKVNPRMSSYQWRLTSMAHVVQWGNAYSEIVRNGLGDVVELWPLRPDRMRVTIAPTADGRGKLVYYYRTRVGVETEVPARRIFHIRGLGYDGLIGYSVLALARASLGLTQDAEEFGSRSFRSNARPGLILTHPKTLTEPARANLRQSVTERHEGLANTGKTMLLEEGMSVSTIGWPAKDAEFLATREFQITEIARWFGVQPHRLFDLSHATFTNIEHQGIEWVQDFGAWLVNWEQEFRLQLLDEDPDVFAEFNVDGLLRGDTASRMAQYRSMFGMAAMSPDEIRSRENLNPRPDGKGDSYFAPLNIADASRLDAEGLSRERAIEAVAALVEAGFEPDSATRLLGLPELDHSGLDPVTVRARLDGRTDPTVPQ